MYVGNHAPVVDAIVAVEGEFKCHPLLQADPVLELKMMYIDSKTRQSYGTCPAKTQVFSPETIEAFRAFIRSAENDFGRLFFEGGTVVPYEGASGSSTSKAETGETPRGLGG